MTQDASIAEGASWLQAWFSGRWWWENEDTLAECGLHVSSLARPGEGESGE